MTNRYDEPHGAGHDPQSVGDPDGLERLWTPHRMDYVVGPKPAGPEQSADAPAEHAPAPERASCPFCRVPTLDDEQGLIVARGESAYAVLNLYPYNTGHLMVLPYRHIADYTETTETEIGEIAELTRHAMRTIRTVSSPHGFNIGINAGAIAGAGIAGHLHQHVVPRWNGDANFMPVIGHTKVLPQLLADTRTLIANAW